MSSNKTPPGTSIPTLLYTLSLSILEQDRLNMHLDLTQVETLELHILREDDSPSTHSPVKRVL